MPSLARLEVRGQCERERLKKKQRNCFTSVTLKFAKVESRLETPCSLVTRCSRGFYQTIAMHAYFISVSARSKETKQIKKSYWYREHFEFVHGPGWTLWLWTVLGLPHSPGAASFFAQRLACSRLRDGGEKSFSKKKMRKTRWGWGETRPPFPSGARRFARFNTSPLYYLRAWHRLHRGESKTWLTGDEAKGTIR